MMEDNLRSVSLVCCLLLVASLSTAESVTPGADTGPAVSDKKDVTAAQADAPSPEVTPPPAATAPKEAGTQEPALQPSENVKQAPPDTKESKKGPAPGPKPEAVAKDGGKETGRKTSEKKAEIPEQAPKKPASKDESLFSVEEAEKAGTDEAATLLKQEKRKTVDKEGSLFSVEEAEEAAKFKTAPAKKKVEAAEKPKDAAKEETKKKRSKVSLKRRKDKKKKKEWTEIQLGFAYKDVQLLQGSYSFETHFIGEMINKSDRDYGIVKYMFSTYNKRGKLITEEAFQITDFYRGQIKNFSGTIIDSYQQIASHKIRFLSAAPTSKG
ncbi:MAG: hypothetical protein GY800_03605 [Planctomycetes bacterium]|nr:hypothetical protein [Planctomycetota bacterium]